MRKEKRREEGRDAQPRNTLEPSFNPRMESLQIFTSTLSLSLSL